MHFSVQLPTDRVERGSEFMSRDAVVAMARAVERAGFDACYVTEHPFPSDAWLASGGHHALDPFVTAKAIASLDALSERRVIVGVAAGYLEDEYEALGADFAHRNAVTDEALDVNFVPFGFGMNTREPLDADAFCEQVEQLEALGVTWLSLGLPFRDRGDYEQIVGRFHRAVNCLDNQASIVMSGLVRTLGLCHQFGEHTDRRHRIIGIMYDGGGHLTDGR